MRKFVAVIAVLLLPFALGGCPKLWEDARDAVSSSQGFIEEAQHNHLAECQANPMKPFPCVMINQAVGAQNLLADAIDLYCGWPVRPGVEQFKDLAGKPCASKPEYKKSLESAVKGLNSIIGDYKLAANAK
jgi:hypothetical protein